VFGVTYSYSGSFRRLTPGNGGATVERRDAGPFPVLFQAANTASVQAKQQLLRLTALGLAMVVLGAAGGAITVHLGSSPVDWGGVVAAVAFGLAALVELTLLRRTPDRTWLDGRTLAESVMTLAWRFAVGAEPFRVDIQSPDEAEALLVQRLRVMLVEGRRPSLLPRATGEQVTLWMRSLRAAPLHERQHAYEQGRIADQAAWYADRAVRNDRRARQWGAALVGVQAVAIVGATLKAAGILRLDLLGVAGATAASIGVWTQVRQHDILAHAYAVTAQELALIRTGIERQTDEASWSRFVEDTEAVISREQVLPRT
jgi:hypothetical protein